MKWWVAFVKKNHAVEEKCRLHFVLIGHVHKFGIHLFELHGFLFWFYEFINVSVTFNRFLQGLNSFKHFFIFITEFCFDRNLPTDGQL